jgi:hypothetical protein
MIKRWGTTLRKRNEEIKGRKEQGRDERKESKRRKCKR